MKETINLINETKVKQWLDDKGFSTKRYYELEDKKRNNRTKNEQAEYEELEKERNKILEPLGKELVEYFKNQPPQNKEKIQHNLRKKKISNSFASNAMRTLTDIRPLVKDFHHNQPFFYDKNKIWWLWNKGECRYEFIDEIDLINSFDHLLGTSSISLRQSARNEIIEALKRYGRANIPLIPPREWIQFGHKVLDIISGEEKDAVPDYFFTNPLNWIPSHNSNTPTLDKLFSEWVGEKYVQTLYELISYCCYRDYPIQLIFCLYGSGRNGKSQFLKILKKFIGENNRTTTELDLLLSNRFETFKLYKKLVCFMGETNFDRLKKTALIKKIVGGDDIGFEMKNKQPFDDLVYCKLIIASNSLPSTNDTTDGYFRRWLIIDFPNEFEESGQEVWETVPEEEYRALARKVLMILPNLLKQGKLRNQGSIEERRNKYISVSNPLPLFLKECCESGDEEDYFVRNKELFSAYLVWLKKNKKRQVKKTEFTDALNEEGYFANKCDKQVSKGVWRNNYFVEGIRLKENSDNSDNSDSSSTRSYAYSNQVRNLSELSEKSEIISEEFLEGENNE